MSLHQPSPSPNLSQLNMENIKNNNTMNNSNSDNSNNNNDKSNDSVSITAPAMTELNLKRIGESNSLLYQRAARNLREYHGVPSMTAGTLEKTMTLLQLAPGRLVVQGLAPNKLLKGETTMPDDILDTSSGSEVEQGQEGVLSNISTNTSTSNSSTCTSTSISSDNEDSEQDDGCTKVPKEDSKRPIHAALIAAGIKLRPRETRPLLRALGVRPRRLVKLGLVQREALLRSRRPGGRGREGSPHQHYGRTRGRGHRGRGMGRPHGSPRHTPPPHGLDDFHGSPGRFHPAGHRIREHGLDGILKDEDIMDLFHGPPPHAHGHRHNHHRRHRHRHHRSSSPVHGPFQGAGHHRHSVRQHGPDGKQQEDMIHFHDVAYEPLPRHAPPSHGHDHSSPSAHRRRRSSSPIHGPPHGPFHGARGHGHHGRQHTQEDVVRPFRDVPHGPRYPRFDNEGGGPPGPPHGRGGDGDHRGPRHHGHGYHHERHPTGLRYRPGPRPCRGVNHDHRRGHRHGRPSAHRRHHSSRPVQGPPPGPFHGVRHHHHHHPIGDSEGKEGPVMMGPPPSRGGGRRGPRHRGRPNHGRRSPGLGHGHGGYRRHEDPEGEDMPSSGSEGEEGFGIRGRPRRHFGPRGHHGGGGKRRLGNHNNTSDGEDSMGMMHEGPPCGPPAGVGGHHEHHGHRRTPGHLGRTRRRRHPHHGRIPSGTGSGIHRSSGPRSRLFDGDDHHDEHYWRVAAHPGHFHPRHQPPPPPAY